MTIPTRIIDKPEFMELSKAEGDTITLYKLVNIPFSPPLPNGWAKPNKDKIAAMNVLLMNVHEPVIYKDKASNTAYIIMNGYDQEATFTYENFQDCHLIKNSWGYRLAPSYWDPTDRTDDLDDAIYRFRHETREGQGLDEV